MTTLLSFFARRTVERFALDNPGVQLVDWYGVATSTPGILYDDGVHARPEGYALRGRLVADAPWTFDGRQFAGWVPHQAIAYLWPQGPWYWLGDAYYHNGRAVGLDDPYGLAEQAFRRGWALDSANACAVASPIPDPAPVTTATRSWKW